ncbi:S-protein homolog 5-like [Vigna radiata var. radiata]|uniref:S-protein homolog n=1 Tax=Vigna radiata var. radiata TaxID=3916 RepID=A0A1S3W1Z1_VIGRR|nr:S-protein homolog 5-like [Vigna radiata var. radiata]
MSKITAVGCLFLAIFVGVQLKCLESGIALRMDAVTVQITNRLSERYLAVHCKDKHNDLGLHQLNVGETYGFKFYPELIFPTTLYFCHFTWLEEDHYFDIYVQKRDGYCNSDICAWDILPTGPCRTNKDPRQCYGWNPPSAVQQSNNTLLL